MGGISAAAACLLLALVGCGGSTRGSALGPVSALAGTTFPSAADPVAAAASPGQGGYVAVVLVAGSDQQAVFDNARRAFARELGGIGRLPQHLTMLSARDETAGADTVRPATLAALAAAFAAEGPRAAACLLIATSHGARAGFLLAERRELLTPIALDRILGRSCAGKPTIVIISACFSGIFVDPPMPAENRIILTAAARDRPSFGCGDDLTYTYFDAALLQLLPGARGWRQLHADLKAEVTARERSLGERPSHPQAAFGAEVPDDALLGR